MNQLDSQVAVENADDLSAKSISWWKYFLPFHYF